LTCDPTDTSAATANKSWARRCNLQKQSKVIGMVGRIHAVVCNCQTFIVPRVTVNVRLTKGRREFYLMTKDIQVTLNILEARLLVRHITANPSVIYAHKTTLEAGRLAKYHLTRVEVNVHVRGRITVTVYR
jgi:hypothetical protein